MLKEYRRGLVSVSFGSNAVTGIDTRWVNYVSEGDILNVGSDSAVIGAVNNSNTLTLSETWGGTTLTNERYLIEINPNNLKKKKAEKKIDINQERSRRCQLNVMALGHIWQADNTSQDLLNRAITLTENGLPLPNVWRDWNNVDMPITSINDLLAIAGAIGEQTQAAYARSWEMKVQVDEATTAEELNLIVW